MIKEIIFDCFGVLTEDGWLAFMQQYDTGEHTEELRYLNHQIDKGSIGYEELLEEVARLTTATKAEAHKIITVSHHPNTSLYAYIRELHEQGYQLGIISNVGTSLESFIPKEYMQLFTTVTLSYEVGATKPDARIFEAHLVKTGLSAGETVFIDDRSVNCEGAQSLGITSIVYRDVATLKAELEAVLSR